MHLPFPQHFWPAAAGINCHRQGHFLRKVLAMPEGLLINMQENFNWSSQVECSFPPLVLKGLGFNVGMISGVRLFYCRNMLRITSYVLHEKLPGSWCSKKNIGKLCGLDMQAKVLARTSIWLDIKFFFWSRCLLSIRDNWGLYSMFIFWILLQFWL